MPASKSHVALLRAINVGGRNKVPMAELRALAESLGWSDVGSYIQSGNLVFRAPGRPAALAADLQRAVQRAHGFEVPVVVRSAAQWRELVDGNPFPEASRERPSWVLLHLSQARPSASAVDVLAAHAGPDERIERVRDAIWIDFANGVARSKLTPARIDRAAGSATTARNWRTVVNLAEMLEELPD